MTPFFGTKVPIRLHPQGWFLYIFRIFEPRPVR